MVLRPGNNTFNISGTIDQGPILAALAQRPYCTNGGILPFQLAGNAVVNAGEPIPWLAGALGAQNLSVSIDLGPAVKVATGINIPCVSNVTARMF
jgi:hypothetical protein